MGVGVESSDDGGVGAAPRWARKATRLSAPAMSRGAEAGTVSGGPVLGPACGKASPESPWPAGQCILGDAGWALAGVSRG